MIPTKHSLHLCHVILLHASLRMQELLLYAYRTIKEETKLIRFAIFTSMSHGLVIIALMLLQIYIAFSNDTEIRLRIVETILWNIEEVVSNNTILTLLIIFGVLFAISYIFFPPIGDGWMIWYLSRKESWQEKWFGRAVTVWLKKFFALFTFNNTIGLFTVITYIPIVIRLYVDQALWNPLIIWLLVVRGVIIIALSFVIPLAKISIVMEGKNPAAALRRWAELAIDNFWLTITAKLLQLLLWFRFIINMVIVFGVPFWIAYLAVTYGELNSLVLWIMWVVIILLVIAVWYANSIIDAFFMAYWFKLYTICIAQEE